MCLSFWQSHSYKKDRLMTLDPTLEELLNDPVIQILMRRDGVSAEALRALMRRLKAKAASSAKPK
jgi:hypothetical protein